MSLANNRVVLINKIYRNIT